MNLDKVRVQFLSKQPHNTVCLSVWADANDEPREMYAALEKIGWHKDSPQMPAQPAKDVLAMAYARQDETPIIESTFQKGGSGFFKDWTPAEHRDFLPEVRNVLRKFGFVRVEHRKLKLRDLR